MSLSTPTASLTSNHSAQEQPDFSLVQGGLLFQVLVRSRLATEPTNRGPDRGRTNGHERRLKA